MLIEKVITRNIAANLLFLLFVCGITFHILVLLGLIPHDVVWGGRVDAAHVKYLEGVSILVGLFILMVVSMKVGYLRPLLSLRVINAVLWILVVLFSLNTVGNMFAVSVLERVVFTPIALISAVLCYRLVQQR